MGTMQDFHIYLYNYESTDASKFHLIYLFNSFSLDLHARMEWEM